MSCIPSPRLLTLAVTVALLSGCPATDESAAGNPLLGCTPIAGGLTRHSTSVSDTCTGCEVTDPQKAIDGDGATFATLLIPGGAPGRFPGIVALRATAQPGVVYPEGSPVGIVHSLPPGTDNGFGGTLATYLGDVQQEQFDFNGISAEPALASFTASHAFNAVEVRIAQVPSSSSAIGRRAWEFCAG